MLRRFLLALLLAAAALLPGPFGAAPAEPVEPLIAPGHLLEWDLRTGRAAFRFSVSANSLTDICLFPTELPAPRTRVELYEGDELIASGADGLIAVSERLKADTTYRLVLEGDGRVRLEIARHALSRCFALPLALDARGDEYAKAIAHAGDAHWYALESADGRPIMIAGIPQAEGLALQAQLFDERGLLIAEASRTSGGAFLMDHAPSAGEKLLLRVCSIGLQTGLYTVRVEPGGEGGLPDLITLSEESLSLQGRSAAQLRARVHPENAGGLVFWESSDPAVARVSPAGEVTGQRPGTAMITAYGAGGVSARCRVDVAYVAATGIDLLGGAARLRVGDDMALECAVLPENASDPRIDYAVAPEGVVEIDRRGVLWAVAEGTATVTATSRDGGFQDELTVRVLPARRQWRALLVGEQNYAATVAATRLGSANSVASLRSMLGELDDNGAKFQVRTLLDASRDGVLAGIRDTFAGATERDFGLFYITCHGYYADGMTFFQMYDGSVLSAAELEQALRGVPGNLLILLDCCGSGGAIGAYSGPEDLLGGITAVFDGNVGGAPFAASRYRVLASAALEQDSYRISFNETATEADMSTVFARALCEAGGWSMDRAARGAMRADVDYDGAVTFGELSEYVARRVMWYLDVAGRLSGGVYAQNVQAWPEGDVLPVFTRSYDIRGGE